MEKQVKVSVIIPCYNAENFIKETLHSVLTQTLSELEVIIVNDGSKDTTEGIIKSFQDERIRYYYKENSGVADSRNFGIERAKGEYISFLDADDLFLPNNLKEKVNFLENHPDIHLVHAPETIFESTTGEQQRDTTGQGGKVLTNLLEFTQTVIHSPSSVVIRKTLYDKIGGFDTHLSTSADWEYWVRIAQTTAFGYLPQALSKYRIHDNQMHMNIPLMDKDMHFAFKKCKAHGIFKSQKYYLYCYAKLALILSGSYFHHTKTHNKTIYYLLASLMANPTHILQKFIKPKSK